MKSQNLRTSIFLFLGLTIIVACNSKPRVIESEPEKAEVNNSAILNNSSSDNVKENTDEHKVIVEEVLHAEKYTYLNVSENEELFWIAIPRTEVQVGDTYYYKNGLMKKHFYSQEFKREFETIYLVSRYWKEPSDAGGSALDEALSNAQGGAASIDLGDITPAEGAIKISEIVGNKEKYEDKSVLITGKCVKVNLMIMGRNWVHIKDGSMDDFDFVVTTSENITVGTTISLEGTVTLNKDFGAGYKYDIIMEEARLK